MLLELARLLTPGRGPSVDPDRLNQLRRDNPLAVYNPAWDARRLWLTQFVEQQRQVRLEGMARDGEDVSELARRMSLSSYFIDVQLLAGEEESCLRKRAWTLVRSSSKRRRGTEMAKGPSALSRLNLAAKIGIGVALLALVGVVYFVVFYGDLASSIKAEQGKERQLREELAERARRRSSPIRRTWPSSRIGSSGSGS